jgi:hypothetical protein
VPEIEDATASSILTPKHFWKKLCLDSPRIEENEAIGLPEYIVP